MTVRGVSDELTKTLCGEICPVFVDVNKVGSDGGRVKVEAMAVAATMATTEMMAAAKEVVISAAIEKITATMIMMHDGQRLSRPYIPRNLSELKRSLAHLHFPPSLPAWI